MLWKGCDEQTCSNLSPAWVGMNSLTTLTQATVGWQTSTCASTYVASCTERDNPHVWWINLCKKLYQNVNVYRHYIVYWESLYAWNVKIKLYRSFAAFDKFIASLIFRLLDQQIIVMTRLSVGKTLSCLSMSTCYMHIKTMLRHCIVSVSLISTAWDTGCDQGLLLGNDIMSQIKFLFWSF
jgi:hypothetical protein